MQNADWAIFKTANASSTCRVPKKAHKDRRCYTVHAIFTAFSTASWFLSRGGLVHLQLASRRLSFRRDLSAGSIPVNPVCVGSI